MHKSEQSRCSTLQAAWATSRRQGRSNPAHHLSRPQIKAGKFPKPIYLGKSPREHEIDTLIQSLNQTRPPMEGAR